MRKIYLLFIAIFLFSSCTKDKEYNVENIKALKDYTLFENIEGNLDIKNAATALYNKELPLAFLLDVTKENDYEKYFPKYDKINSENINLENKNAVFAEKFIKEGEDLTSSYRTIIYYYINRDNPEFYSFDNIIYPYTDFLYEEESINIIENEMKNIRKTISNKVEAIRLSNLAILKARNMIKYALENDLKNESDKVKAEANLMIAISYIAQDRLYNILEIKKYAAIYKELGGKDINYLKNDKDNKELTSLLTYVAYNDNIGVVELLKDSKEKGFLHIVLSRSGVYNFLNDDYYMPVGFIKRDNYTYLNPYYEAFSSNDLSNIYLYIQGTGYYNKDKSAMNYKQISNYNDRYINDAYILCLNGAVYIVEMEKDNPLKVEFRNDAYFNVNFPLLNDASNLVQINSEYNIPFTQKDYIIYENGKPQTVWNGNIRNQKADESKLVKFKNIVNCFDKNFKNIESMCGIRENLYKAKFIYEKKCSNKVDCIITTDDFFME